MARVMRALANAAIEASQRKLELLKRCGYQNHQTTTQSNRKPIKNSIGVSIIAASLHSSKRGVRWSPGYAFPAAVLFHCDDKRPILPVAIAQSGC